MAVLAAFTTASVRSVVMSPRTGVIVGMADTVTARRDIAQRSPPGADRNIVLGGRMSADPIGSVVASIEQEAAGSERFVLGITGSPGSGKTTLATAIVERLRERTTGGAAHLPMDGFHLA